MLLARITVGVLGAGSVGLLYVVGRRAFGLASGLLAAALLAVNFLHVHFSHYARDDVPAGFFLVAALIPTLRLLERPGHWGFLLAGLFSGLAAAAKYNFGLVGFAPLAAYTVLIHRQVLRGNLLLLAPVLLGLGALVGFVMGMPDTIWAFREVREGILWRGSIADRPWPGQAPDPVAVLYGKTLLIAFGPPAALAAVAGFLLLLRRRPAMGFVLAACPVAYLAFMAIKPLEFHARFALPLVPFGCLFAAYGAVRFWSAIRLPRRRAVLAVLTCLALLGLPAFLSVRLDMLAGETDTRVQARQWVFEHLPRGTKLAHQTYSLPSTMGGDEITRAYQTTHFEWLARAESAVQLACTGHQYVLLSSYQTDRDQMVGPSGQPTGYEIVATRGRLVKQFWPGPNDTSVPLNISDIGLPFWELLRYARPGPTISVYKLPPDAC